MWAESTPNRHVVEWRNNHEEGVFWDSSNSTDDIEKAVAKAIEQCMTKQKQNVIQEETREKKEHAEEAIKRTKTTTEQKKEGYSFTEDFDKICCNNCGTIQPKSRISGVCWKCGNKLSVATTTHQP